MIVNSYKYAIRYLLKNRLFTVVNFFGFLIGFTASFYLASYIYHESTFDAYQPDVENTYRLLSVSENGESGTSKSAISFLPIAEYIVNDIPEVKEITRVQLAQQVTLRKDEKLFIESNLVWADDNLFDFFKVDFIRGSPEKALSEPLSIVLTEEGAIKFFGSQDPIGDFIFKDTLALKVTGVIKDLPSNTHFAPNMIASLNTFQDLDNPWGHQGYIYLRTDNKSIPFEVSSKISSRIQSNIWWLTNPPSFELQQMKDVHLHSTGITGSPLSVDIKYLYIFGIISIILIFSTAFNYITLSIANFSVRTKEVAMRKILGAGNKGLIVQPLIECSILSLAAAFAAIVLLMLLAPYMNSLLETRLTPDFFLTLPNATILLSVFSLLFLVSGTYPALAISRFLPFAKLQESKLPRGNALLRKVLVTTQFMIAMILMVSLIVVNTQLDFLGNRKLGFDKEQVLVLKTPKFAEINIGVMKDKLRQIPGVSYISSAVNTPFGGGFISSSEYQGNAFKLSEFNADEDYVNTLGLTVLEGRDLVATDSNRVIVNEAMVQAMGWTDPIGQKKSGVFAKDFEVVGVLKDYHLNSTNTPIHPVMITLGKQYTSNLLVRLESQNLVEVISRISQEWNKAEPDHPLEYSFLDEQFDSLYKSEIQFRELSSIFSGIAIFIACLGLYSFIAYATQQKVKEIGIRKVMGASVAAILGLIGKDLFNLMLIALLLSVPISWFVADRWLENFAYRIDVQWWMFGIAGMTTLVIALLTVSSQAIKAALANPVNSLKSE